MLTQLFTYHSSIIIDRNYNKIVMKSYLCIFKCFGNRILRILK